MCDLTLPGIVNVMVDCCADSGSYLVFCGRLLVGFSTLCVRTVGRRRRRRRQLPSNQAYSHQAPSAWLMSFFDFRRKLLKTALRVRGPNTGLTP